MILFVEYCLCSVLMLIVGCVMIAACRFVFVCLLSMMLFVLLLVYDGGLFLDYVLLVVCYLLWFEFGFFGLWFVV